MPGSDCCENLPFTKDPRTNKKLCSTHFSKMIEKRFLKTISKYNMIEKNEHIGLGYSGGKDSTVLLHLFSKFLQQHKNTKMTLITIDEEITGYREGCIDLVKIMAQKYQVRNILIPFSALYGESLDYIVKESNNLNRSLSPCALCGILRRRALNYGAKLAGVSKIATAHNLDDEAQSIIMNLMRGDSKKFIRYSRRPIHRFPSLPPRIRPLVTISEPEIVFYAIANDLEYHSIPCPYASSAMRNDIREFLFRMEKKRPSTLINIVNLHDSIEPFFKKEQPQLKTFLCEKCHEVTTHSICPVCQLLESIGLELHSPNIGINPPLR
ncbi:MAG: TIGR00269 family protein [Candidatus Hodarchaeales archaeon]